MSILTAGDDKQAETAKRKRSRSVAIALALAGMAVLFYVATLVHLGAGG